MGQASSTIDFATALRDAESEGMGGGEENMLGRVELAIALVEKQP